MSNVSFNVGVVLQKTLSTFAHAGVAIVSAPVKTFRGVKAGMEAESLRVHNLKAETDRILGRNQPTPTAKHEQTVDRTVESESLYVR